MKQQGARVRTTVRALGLAIALALPGAVMAAVTAHWNRPGSHHSARPSMISVDTVLPVLPKRLRRSQGVRPSVRVATTASASVEARTIKPLTFACPRVVSRGEYSASVSAARPAPTSNWWTIRRSAPT